MSDYEKTGQVLADRIEALIPRHPQIVNLTDAFELFKLPGFECGDLEPSLAQAQAALSLAQRRYRERFK